METSLPRNNLQLRLPRQNTGEPGRGESLLHLYTPLSPLEKGESYNRPSHIRKCIFIIFYSSLRFLLLEFYIYFVGLAFRMCGFLDVASLLFFFLLFVIYIGGRFLVREVYRSILVWVV